MHKFCGLPKDLLNIKFQLLEEDQHLEMLEISMEIASEFPFSNNNWPSDITFSLNNKYLGTWTSPGDFSDIRERTIRNGIRII